MATAFVPNIEIAIFTFGILAGKFEYYVLIWADYEKLRGITRSEYIFIRVNLNAELGRSARKLLYS